MFVTTIVGNLGKDAEMKTTKNGKEYISFSVGVDVGFGENRSTQWVNVKRFGNAGVLKHLTKGTKVSVVGDTELGVFKEKAQCYVTAYDIKLLSKGPPKTESASFSDVKHPDDNDAFPLPEFDGAPA
jgi:single-strand DNA-binding protein